jgi:hypothetical protein
MGWLSFILVLSKLIIAIFIIFLFAVVCYIGYLLFTKMYPRPFALGHTEPFEAYMQLYITQWIKTLYLFRDADSAAIAQHPQLSEAKMACTTFLDAMVNYEKQYQALKKKTVSADDKGPSDIKQFTLKDIPHIYFLFIFYSHLSDDKPRTKGQILLMKRFAPFDKIENFYENGSETVVENITPLKELHNSYLAFKKAIRKVAASVRADFQNIETITNPTTHNLLSKVYQLDLMHNVYLKKGRDNIVKSYNLRKTGGLGNFVIYEIYMSDYVQYVFKDTIPRIWNNYLKDMIQSATFMQEWMASEKVSSFVANIPFKIAGEGFEDAPEEVARAMRGDGEDTEEHFIGALIAIAKVFMMLPKIILAIINAIANPMMVIKLLMGLIIGLFVYIMYMLLLVLSFLFFIPAFFVVTFGRIGQTILWTALFVLIAVVYLVLYILDTVTGGAVFTLLRCENLPSAWHLNPNYARGSHYKRTFMCSGPCAKRFAPVDSFCVRTKDFEPSYCPQQLIYSAYEEYQKLLDEKPLSMNFKPDVSYFVKMNAEEKHALWREIHQARIDFTKTCDAVYGVRNRKIDARVNADKPDYDDFDYSAMTRQICNYYANNQEFKLNYPELYTKIMTLCKYCNCKDKYFNTDPAKEDTSHVPYSSTLSYCKTDPAKEIQEIPPNPKKKTERDIISNVVILCILMIIMLLVSAMVFNTVKSFDYQKFYESATGAASELVGAVSKLPKMMKKKPA